MGDTSGKTPGKEPRDHLMKSELVLRELGAKSEDEGGWEPEQPACLTESAKEGEEGMGCADGWSHASGCVEPEQISGRTKQSGNRG
mmetsp:Transcript_87132/g.172992  ORF Transcript_87132/g.172992 Transcript_87132/m.172992 type:complete len:86 (-) Transcript_87132:111-368(-)